MTQNTWIKNAVYRIEQIRRRRLAASVSSTATPRPTDSSNADRWQNENHNALQYYYYYIVILQRLWSDGQQQRLACGCGTRATATHSVFEKPARADTSKTLASTHLRPPARRRRRACTHARTFCQIYGSTGSGRTGRRRSTLGASAAAAAAAAPPARTSRADARALAELRLMYLLRATHNPCAPRTGGIFVFFFYRCRYFDVRIYGRARIPVRVHRVRSCTVAVRASQAVSAIYGNKVGSRGNSVRTWFRYDAGGTTLCSFNNIILYRTRGVFNGAACVPNVNEMRFSFRR